MDWNWCLWCPSIFGDQAVERFGESDEVRVVVGVVVELKDRVQHNLLDSETCLCPCILGDQAAHISSRVVQLELGVPAVVAVGVRSFVNASLSSTVEAHGTPSLSHASISSTPTAHRTPLLSRTSL